MEIGARTPSHDGTIPWNPLEELSLEQLRARTSMKWRAHPSDVLPLWVAEMDVRLAPAVAEALHRAIDAGDTGYPAGTAYAEALGAFAARQWGWDGLAVSRTTLVPDVMMGVVAVLRLVTDPGDAVVVNPPVYAPFYAFVSHDGRRIVEAPLTDDGRISLASLEDAFQHVRALGGKRAAYLLSNPHNPTGTVHTRAELAAIAQLARAYGIRVVADEIHAPLVLPGARFTPYLSVLGAEDAFALTSASKGWNLAGLKAALALAGPEAAGDLRRMPEEVSHGPSHLGVIAHTAAYRDGQDWLEAVLRGLDANRTLLGQLVATHLPGIRYQAPEGTYLAWLDCRRLGLDADLDAGSDADRDADRDAEVHHADQGDQGDQGDLPVVSDLAGPAQLFLDRARVALSSGHVFGRGGAGHVRLNFATSPAILTEAVTRMGQAVHELQRP